MQKSRIQGCFYGKLDNGKYFCIIDTPGFSDSGGKDYENYETIKNYLIDTQSCIKGIYIICNFQEERFNNAEQKCVKAISDLFPLKNFWNYVSIIFTHYYDKGCDSRVKMKLSIQDSLKQVKENLIQDAYKRNLIDIIPHDKINTLYIDIYNDAIENNINEDNLDDNKKKELQKKKKENEGAYQKLIKDIKDKIKEKPLYDKVEIISKEVILYEENTKFSYNLYNAKIVKRLFYLENKILAIDIMVKGKPHFKERVNTIWNNLKSVIKILKLDKITISSDGIPVISTYPIFLFAHFSGFRTLNLKKLREIFIDEYKKIEIKENIFS